MGQKVNPTAIRLGINTTWSNFWSTDKKTYRNSTELYLTVDRLWKKYVASNLYEDISVQINMREIVIFVTTHRPNVIIGQKGVNINKFQDQIQKGIVKILPEFKKMKLNINIKIKEVSPETSPVVMCEQINDALIAKRDYKKILKYLAVAAMQNGALGVKFVVSGRIGGRAIASSVMKKFGSIPLQTLSANIHQAQKHVLTKSGCCGVTCTIALASN